MHIPFAQQEQQLALGKVRINLRERHHVKRRVPGGEPRYSHLSGMERMSRAKVSPVAVATALLDFGGAKAVGFAVNPVARRCIRRIVSSTAGQRNPADRSWRPRRSPSFRQNVPIKLVALGDALRHHFLEPSESWMPLSSFSRCRRQRTTTVAQAGTSNFQCAAPFAAHERIHRAALAIDRGNDEKKKHPWCRASDSSAEDAFAVVFVLREQPFDFAGRALRFAVEKHFAQFFVVQTDDAELRVEFQRWTAACFPLWMPSHVQTLRNQMFGNTWIGADFLP